MEFSLIKTRLISLGIKGEDIEKDKYIFNQFIIPKVENHIYNFCNINEIPKELNEIAVDMVCGEYLLNKKQSGQLDLSETIVNQAITGIKEDDFNITYSDVGKSQSAEEKMDSLINYLMNREEDLLCARKLKW